VRDSAKKEQGRHVRSVDAHAEVQAEFGAVARLDRSYDLAAGHGLTGGERRTHRLIARQDADGMCDLKYVLVDYEAREVHDSVGRGVDASAGGDIDPAVTRRIRRGRCDKRSHDLVRTSHRPRPPVR
jgi:hypothetical protein